MRIGRRKQLALVGSVLLLALPLIGFATTDLVAVDLDGTDPDTRALLESMLDTARENPDSAEARGQLGIAYERNGFGSAALESLSQAETLDASNFLWPYARALLLGCDSLSSPACSAALIDHNAALESMDRALDIDDDYVPAWLWRASWLTTLDRLEEAAAVYYRILELSDGNLAGIAGLSRILLRQNQIDKALALLEPRVKDDEDSKLFGILGRTYQMLGRIDDARIAFARGRGDRRLEWLDPRLAFRDDYFVSYGSRLARTEVILVAGHPSVALQELERLRSKRPDDATLLRLIGTAYQQLGHRALARDVLRQGLRLEPEDYLLNLVMAGVYREAGLVDRSLEHMQRAIDAVPTRGDAHYLRGTILMEQVRYEEALTAFDKSLEFGIKDPEKVLFMAGTIEIIRKDWKAAVSRFEQATNLNVSYARAYLGLAGACAELGRFEEAHKALAWVEKLPAIVQELESVRRHVTSLENATGGTP